jgi:hypothetical protein
MRKRSKIMEAKRRALLEADRNMTPELRLEAYVEHSRLVLEFYRAGVRDRAAAAASPRKR